MVLSRVVRPASPLRAVLLRYRGTLVAVALLSAMINVLALTSSIYLMVIYDRVLVSYSTATLFSLFLIVIVLFVFNGAFDLFRARLLGLVGTAFDRDLAPRIRQIEMRLAAEGRLRSMRQYPLRDLEQIRAFVSSNGPGALIDLPWMVFFLAILALLHPMLGLAALAGGLVLGLVTWLNEKRTFDMVAKAAEAGREQSIVTERVRAHADTLRGLGMTTRLGHVVDASHRGFVDAQHQLARQTSTFGSISRVFRVFIQSAVLTVGALLVIDGQATGGIIFASSILAGRALAPLDAAIANWRSLSSARQGWARINALMSEFSEVAEPSVELPRPSKRLDVERLAVVPPSSQRVAVAEAQFGLTAGDALAIVGPSGSGKSSIARTIAGVWPAARGSVRIDGAPLDQWSEEQLARITGYMPQEIDLFDGSVAQNIAGFDPAASSEGVIAAAIAADVHELVLRLPNGYDTQVGEGGAVLSTGQRQRIALARALYGDPFLLVLDEPDSALDPEGEGALGRAIAGARRRGAIVIVVTHRMALLQHLNLVLVIRDGKQQTFGPRDEVLAALNTKLPSAATRRPSPATPPARGAGK